jgi:hypothetical protein
MNITNCSHVRKIHHTLAARSERSRQPHTRYAHFPGRDVSLAPQPSPTALLQLRQLIPTFAAITGGQTNACVSLHA